jgi:hypothetical protein
METPSNGDLGESLVEILLTIAILGIAFAAVLAGIGTTVLTSGINRDQAQETSDVRAIAERLQSEPFVPCRTTADYQSAVQSAVPASTFTLQVQYSTGGSFVPACAGAAVVLHEIAITTVPADPRAAAPQPLTILKRKP